MHRAAFLPVLAASAALLLSSCGGPSEEVKKEEAGAEGPQSVAVADPCDCFGRELSEGERRYCRESKRDPQFLDALRNCREGEVGGVSAVNNMPDDGQYTIDPDKTVVEWVGSKVGMTEKGTVPIRSCRFTVSNQTVASGTMVVEMNGIQAKSQAGPAGRELARHLRSEDFFHVAQFPTAAFTIVSSRTDGKGNLVLNGKLNIKGQSKEVEALMTFASADPVVATVNLEFNRADFDVRFGSGSFFDDLGDDLIADDVLIRMALVEDASARKTIQ